MAVDTVECSEQVCDVTISLFGTPSITGVAADLIKLTGRSSPSARGLRSNPIPGYHVGGG